MISSPAGGGATSASAASVPSARKRVTSSGLSSASRARKGALAVSRSSADWRLEASDAVIDRRYRPLAIGSQPPPRHCERSEAIQGGLRSEEHTSELQSLMRISYAVF